MCRRMCRRIWNLDLADNCHLSFGSVHIHIEGKLNIHKEQCGLKSLYALKATQRPTPIADAISNACGGRLRDDRRSFMADECSGFW